MGVLNMMDQGWTWRDCADFYESAPSTLYDEWEVRSAKRALIARRNAKR